MQKEIREIERERKGKETGWRKREKKEKIGQNLLKSQKEKRNECERIRKIM